MATSTGFASQTQTLTGTGTPHPFDYGSYDQKTRYLTIAYQWQTSQVLVGVPPALIIGKATVPWISVRSYPSAIMQERTVCPLLAQTTTSHR